MFLWALCSFDGMVQMVEGGGGVSGKAEGRKDKKTRKNGTTGSREDPCKGGEEAGTNKGTDQANTQSTKGKEQQRRSTYRKNEQRCTITAGITGHLIEKPLRETVEEKPGTNKKPHWSEANPQQKKKKET